MAHGKEFDIGFSGVEFFLLFLQVETQLLVLLFKLFDPGLKTTVLLAESGNLILNFIEKSCKWERHHYLIFYKSNTFG